jgi:predicted metal-dependent hydrolase
MTLPVDVIRSPRRRRTVSARIVDGRLEVRVPAGLDPAAETRLVETMRRRLERRTQGADLQTAGAALRRRAGELDRRYFAGRARPASVEYATNQDRRFGSCTISTRRIRLSHRLARTPVWVRDYVLVHELAHLIEPGHTPAFWRLVDRYPLAERARGYLMAIGLESLDPPEPETPDVPSSRAPAGTVRTGHPAPYAEEQKTVEPRSAQA